MITLDIQRTEGADTQVKCYLDGVLLPNFFSYGSEYTDEFIDTDVRQKLTELSYSP